MYIPKVGLTCVEGCEAELVRVSGDAICDGCGKPYNKHPYCRGQRTSTGDAVYFLRVACDGRHLKL